MLALLLSNPLAFFIIFPGLLLSITIHEFAHAWTADHLGDPTPRHQGRVTLNPLAHLDPLGTLLMLLTHFGWGKPVEFDPYNLKNPMRDTAIIAIAGPISNLLVALALSLVIRANIMPEMWLTVAAIQILIINVSLAIFNLVPVYPLDGSKILYALLPRESALEYDDIMQRYGWVLLLLLIIPWNNGGSVISLVISPVISTIVTLLIGT